jgi:hypothetical protein
LAVKKKQEESKLHTLNLHPIQSFSIPCYTEKTGGLPHCQSPASNLLWRHPAEQQVSKQVAHSIPTGTPGQNHRSPLDRLTPHPAKKKEKQNNKQGTEKEHAAEGAGCSECTGEGGRGKELISMHTFSKQRLERQKGQQ